MPGKTHETEPVVLGLEEKERAAIVSSHTRRSSILFCDSLIPRTPDESLPDPEKLAVAFKTFVDSDVYYGGYLNWQGAIQEMNTRGSLGNAHAAKLWRVMEEARKIAHSLS